MTTTTASQANGAATADEGEVVRYEARGRVGVVTLSSPQSRNALSPALFDGLGAALTRAADEGMRALVLAAVGKSFCAGGDLAAVNDIIDGDLDRELGAIVDQLHAVITQLRALPMPTVTAVDGAAVGAGVALALATDVRVIARSASFTTGYLAVGSSPDGGASFHLSRALGTSQALAGFLLNRRFTAEALLRAGLADEVVDDGQADATALALAQQLTTISSDALLAMRDLFYAAPGRSLADHLDAEKAEFLKVARTEAFRQGIAPFARKRIGQDS
jgi:2-(1,2-epoxy-1,2-dihydrophenyl)acetyl-CoA isomerase